MTKSVHSGLSHPHKPILQLGLALIVALGLSLAASAKAQAECMTPDACTNSAVWQKAVAKDYFNKGVWFRGASRTDFGQAYEWGQKATFAFHAGDAIAAQWYKGMADAYSLSARRNAKAADDFFSRAAFTSTAADGNVKRAFQLQAFYNPHPSPQEEYADSQAGGENPDPDQHATAASARPPCRDVKNKSWNFAGVKMWVHPYDFCYRKPNNVLSVQVNIGNDVMGLQDIQIDDEECSQEGKWYEWKNRGPYSGRKVTVTCRWVANAAGIPINVSEMTCKARLYLHSDGSAAYAKRNEGDPTCDWDEWPFW